MAWPFNLFSLEEFYWGDFCWLWEGEIYGALAPIWFSQGAFFLFLGTCPTEQILMQVKTLTGGFSHHSAHLLHQRRKSLKVQRKEISDQRQLVLGQDSSCNSEFCFIKPLSLQWIQITVPQILFFLILASLISALSLIAAFSIFGEKVMIKI